MTLRVRMLLALGITMLALPANAFAQSTAAPPGNAGVDQYLESIPTDSGSAAPRQGSKSGGSSLSDKTRKSLNSSGADGQAVGRLVQATSQGTQEAPASSKPVAHKKKSKKSRSSHSATTTTDAAAVPVSGDDNDPGAGSRTAAVSKALDTGGIGGALPILMVLSAVVAIAFGLRRRTRAQ